MDPIILEEEVSKQYEEYNNGRDFEMTAEVAQYFETCHGIVNTLKYPLDFWKVKLQDNWIRDNMYSKELYRDPYYGLQKVKLRHGDIDIEIPDGMVVAGGFAMYLAGWTVDWNDIDLFVLDKEKAEKYVRGLIGSGIRKGMNCFSFRHGYHSGRRRMGQIILRLYRAPTEIVHGFDLDCCGILWDGTDLWATKRAIYAYENGVNWFDPERASPSYAYRLSKYKVRGFGIGLPLFDKSWIDRERFEQFCWDVSYLYLHYHGLARSDSSYFANHGLNISLTSYRTHGIDSDIGNIVQADTPFDMLEIAREIIRPELPEGYNNEREYVFDVMKIIYTIRQAIKKSDGVLVGSMVRYLSSELSKKWTHKIPQENILEGSIYDLKNVLPDDPVSVLILASHFNFHTGLWHVSDYASPPGNEDIGSIVWKEQDPMQQLTGTFYPSPVENLIEWYHNSPMVVYDDTDSE